MGVPRDGTCSPQGAQESTEEMNQGWRILGSREGSASCGSCGRWVQAGAEDPLRLWRWAASSQPCDWRGGSGPTPG